MKQKSKLNLIAKNIVMDALASAYYKLEDSEYDDLSEDEKDAVIERIHKLGKSMAKRIGEEYYTL